MAHQEKKRGGGGASNVKAPAKGKKGSAGSKKEEDQEETLQAVVLADDYEGRFRPFTLDTPRCLLPLANTPLIEYTLEFLAMSGVGDVFIYCGAHTDQVEGYIKSSKWDPKESTKSPFKTLQYLKSEKTSSVGEALSDLDKMDIITGDFLLVHGDLVSNVPIDGALARHKERKIKTKNNAVMTMILREGGLGAHRTMERAVTPVFVIEPSTNRCLHYEEIDPLQANQYVNLDPALLLELGDAHELEFRSDLIDCGIDICTPDSLALVAFDHQKLRGGTTGYLSGVLKDFELNNKTIHVEIVDNHYAARASSLQMYESVSRDVLGRWTYPLVPDSNLVSGQSYKFERGGLCKENGVILARTCKAGKRTVLGQDTSIGDGSVVENSIIGRRCYIGKNVTIRNAFLWDDVVVRDNSTIDRAIIANEAIIGQGCTIQPGALIGRASRIADNKIIPSSARVTRAKRKREDIGVFSRLPADPKIVGEGGEGYQYEDSDDDELNTLSSTLIYSTAHLNLSSASISTISSEKSSHSDHTPRSRTTSFNSVSDDGDNAANESFHHDAVAGIFEALRDNSDLDSARLEFMGLRLSSNANDHQIRRAVATAFAKRIAQLVDVDQRDVESATADTFSMPGADKVIREMALGATGKTSTGSEEAQIDFLVCLQKDLAHRKNGARILMFACKHLNNEMEIVEDEALIGWWDGCEELGKGEDGEMKRVRGLTRVLVEFVRDQSSGSEEESSEEESD